MLKQVEKKIRVPCVNCKKYIPLPYAENGGKLLGGEIVSGVYICSQEDYRDRCFKLNRWQVKRTYKSINESIKILEQEYDK